MEHKRKCVGCGALKNRENLIKITFDKHSKQVVINPDFKIFGRSVYLCYNNSCIMNAVKKDKLQKNLKTPFSEELKGKLIEYGQYTCK